MTNINPWVRWLLVPLAAGFGFILVPVIAHVAWEAGFLVIPEPVAHAQADAVTEVR